MTIKRIGGIALLAGGLLLVAAHAALAHITLETREAPAHSYYKAVLKVPHGCNGSATLSITVSIPPGVVAVKPMPKPGWSLATGDTAYTEPYVSHGHSQSHGVGEITWSGGNLPDAWYDEFVFIAFLPDRPAGTELAFPVVQRCETGETRWVQVPAAGQDRASLPEPAPILTLLPRPR
jgi:uncharacterized protein YcnI